MLLIRVVCSSYNARASILLSHLSSVVFHSQSHSVHTHLQANDPLIGVTCLVRADTLASSPPPRLHSTMAGLVSRRHVLHEDRIARIVYYVLIYTHSCHEDGA